MPRSGELRTQKLKSHLVRTQSLNVLPLMPGVSQYIAIHATLTARDFFLAYFYPSGPFTSIFSVPAGTPSRGGDVKVYVLDINQPSLPTPFTLFLRLFLSNGPLTCISFHKFFRQLYVFSLCSPSLISASLVLSTIYLFLSLLKWFRRPGAFAVRCDPCRGRKGSWRLRYPIGCGLLGPTHLFGPDFS